MADNKNQSTEKNESNAERDQDEGNMNNGTIGGDMGIQGSSDAGQGRNESKRGESGTDVNPAKEEENNTGSTTGK